jgi:hypothetical protein
MIWKAIKTVHTHFKGIAGRLAELTGTTAEWWNSHGRPPSTFSEQNTGKKWKPLEDYAEAIGLYEQANKGAGLMLHDQLGVMFAAAYSQDCPQINGQEIANKLMKEFSEACTKINTDLHGKNLAELEEIQREMVESQEEHRKHIEDLARYINDRRERREAQSAYSNPLYSAGRVN